MTWSSIVFVCFSKAFPNGEYINLACSIICLWLEGNISSPVRYSHFSYLSIFPDDNGDVFAVSLLISYCSFPSLILSSISITSFYIISKRFFLKNEVLPDARVASIPNKEYGFAVHFLQRFIKSLTSISDEWLNVFLEILVCLEFS